MQQRRKVDLYAKTVEITPPPPPNTRERFRDSLLRALDWAPEEVADTIKDLLRRAA